MTLWRNHGSCQKRARLSQADVILKMLREKRAQGKALELPEIMACGIAQHSARFNELKARGFKIDNEMERDTDGRVLSRYYLRFDPDRQADQDSRAQLKNSLFGDISPDRTYLQ